jgi:hypothetical protein
MDNSNPPSNPLSARTTLKLKASGRKPVETKTPPVPQRQAAGKLKPGAQWSDEYKQRMQADMDALMSR